MGFADLDNMEIKEPGDKHAIGLCVPSFLNPVRSRPAIYIDKDYWDNASEMARESTVFHELGHCVLNLEHNDQDVVIKGEKLKKSLMAPVEFGGYKYLANYQYYVDELFSETKLTGKDFQKECANGKD